jgi:hypothetical protein
MWFKSLEQKIDAAHEALEEARRKVWLAETQVAANKPGGEQFLRDAYACVEYAHADLTKLLNKRG